MQLVDSFAGILKRKASIVYNDLDTDVNKLGLEMLAFMEEHDGMGLACPQIGEDKRMFVMRVPVHPGSIFAKTRICVNPELLDWDLEEYSALEGCLSLPGTLVKVSRPAVIRVCYYNEKWESKKEELQGLEARVFQHELDHLDGILITNYDRPIRFEPL